MFLESKLLCVESTLKGRRHRKILSMVSMQKKFREFFDSLWTLYGLHIDRFDSLSMYFDDQISVSMLTYNDLL